MAKSVFQVHGVDRQEKAIRRRRLRRESWVKVLAQTVEPGCEIGMESCGGAHHWARKLQEKGFTVKLIAPQFVKPYVKSNKNDANDAEAICEAMSRPGMRFVAVKIRTAKGKDDRLSQWITRLAARRHPNVVAVALANKTARMAWAMLRNGIDYQPDLVRV